MDALRNCHRMLDQDGILLDLHPIPPSMHAFSHGRDLVVCNCGPAQDDLEQSSLLFRQGIAHSCPTINALSAASIPQRHIRC